MLSAPLTAADCDDVVRAVRRDRPRLRVLRAGVPVDDEQAQLGWAEEFTAVELAAAVRSALDAEQPATPVPVSATSR